MKRWLIQLLVLVIATAAIGGGLIALRYNTFTRSWSADPSELGFFWTENAFHFRHFQMVAEGLQIPDRDIRIQHPEGLDVKRYITPVMEKVSGWIYWNFFFGKGPERFILWYTFVISILTLPAMVVAVRHCGKSIPIALLCAILYGLAPASYYRAVGEGFLREHFALPFIFLSFALFLGCFKKDHLALAAASAVTFAVALASWHVSQLYLTMFMVGCGVVFVATGGKSFPKKSLLVFCAVTAFLSVTMPVLRAKLLLFSPALMLGYGIVLCAFLVDKGDTTRRSRLIWLAVLAAFVVAGFAIHAMVGTYSHVYALLFDKIRFMGRLPTDPNALSFESRLMWTSSFISPGGKNVAILLQGTLIAGAVGMVVGVGRVFSRTISPMELLILFMAAAAFVLFLLIDRMSVFTVFFVTLAGAVACDLGDKKLRIAAMAGLLVMSVAQLAFHRRLEFRPTRPDIESLRTLYLSVSNFTSPNSAFLTTFQLGPGLAAYTGRPVVLHSKFESEAIRNKVGKFYSAFFQDEASLHQECMRLGIDFVIYEPAIALLRGRGSVRYIAGLPPLSTSSAAYLFHFAPEQLKYFIPVFQASNYRGYALDTSFQPTPFEYDPIYDLSVYTKGTPPGEVMSDAAIDAGREALLRSDTFMELGQRNRQAGNIGAAIEMYKRAAALDRGVNYPAGWQMGELLAINGQIEDAIRVFVQVSINDPGFDPLELDVREPDVWAALGKIETQRRPPNLDRAIRLYERALEFNPSHNLAIAELATALIFHEEPQRAVDMAKNLVVLAPTNAPAYALLAKSYFAASNFVKAIEAIDVSLALDPRQEMLKMVRQRLEEKATEVATEREKINAESLDDGFDEDWLLKPPTLQEEVSFPELTLPVSEGEPSSGPTN